MYWLPSDALAHHGILGQKWGVRRYQNKDGSLTNAGKQRYSHTLDKAKKMANLTAELERRTRFYKDGVQKGQYILVTSDEKKEYSRLINEFVNETKILGKEYKEVINNVKSMDDGYDYIQTLIRDDKLDAYVEYLSVIGKTK